jgi:glycosyltransferase involved in cell wall biosynthesis
MSELLFFDAAPTGHHGEFFENLVYGMPSQIAQGSVILAHPDLKLRLEAAKGDCGSEIRLDYLGTAQLDSLNGAKSLFERGRMELKIVEDACVEFGVKQIFLMHMNVHQYALRTGLRKQGISVRGILLNPYTPLRRAYTWKQKLFAGITALRKRFQFRLMFSNPQIDRVFVLNDARVAEELNRSYPRRRPFASVVDPVPAMVLRCGVLVESSVSRSARYTFLFLGSMAPRKGCLEVLRAMQQMTVDELSQIRLRFVGKFRAEATAYRSEVFNAIGNLKEKCPAIDIEVEDRYIDFSEMDAELMVADCVLAPYLGFFGSSGILGHACRVEKPMIACEEGLLGELVRELEVGLTVNPRDSGALANCLRVALKGELPGNTVAAARYTKAADYRKFSETLIADWNE